MKDEYDDILEFPYNGVLQHARMPAATRGAQFAPFAALTGHEAAIRETARLTDMRIEQSEDALKELQEKFNELLPDGCGSVVLTYFRRDPVKAGGEYITEKAVVKRMDDICRELILNDGRRLALDDILDLAGA